MFKKLCAELLGTAWLVFGGCGSAVPSVNPARSTGPALFVGGWALQQLWLFWLAPAAGAIAAGVVHRTLFENLDDKPPVTSRPTT